MAGMKGEVRGKSGLLRILAVKYLQIRGGDFASVGAAHG